MTTVPRGAITAADGLVIVDKPQGWTSHDVVARTRRLAATKKVGHAGTLDPMATGVLVLGVGRATRLLTYLVGADKEYTATVRLGQRTVTDDAEGEVTAAPGIAGLLSTDCAPDTARLEDAMAALRGPIEQVPSAVSAVKIDGQRSYARVRAGQDIELDARPITVHRFELTDSPVVRQVEDTTVLDLEVLVSCSSGTYVRALARDLGEALGTGGHLTALRRTRVGPFGLDEARTLEDLAAAVEADTASDAPGGLPVTSLTQVARAAFATRELDADETRALRVGRPLALSGHDAVVAALAPDGHVVALLRDERGKARPALVLDPA